MYLKMNGITRYYEFAFIGFYDLINITNSLDVVIISFDCRNQHGVLTKQMKIVSFKSMFTCTL